MIRSLLLFIDIAITTTMALVIVLLFGWSNPHGQLGKYVIYYWSLIIIKISGIKLNIHGHEHLKADHGYIVVANHQHIYDVPLIIYASILHPKD